MTPVGIDADGHPIPGVPEPGDRIRVLWEADPDEDFPQHWDHVYLVRLDASGLWSAPVDDYSGATWTSWDRIRSMEGPTP